MSDSNASPIVKITVEVNNNAVTVSSTNSAMAPRANDSPAWNPDSHALGEEFFKTHSDDHNDARRSELEFIYSALANPTATYANLKKFQRLLGEFSVEEPMKLAPAKWEDSVENAEPVLGAQSTDTVVLRINRYLGSLGPTPNTPTNLSHTQLLLFWHLLREQEDLKLISPFDTKALPW